MLSTSLALLGYSLLAPQGDIAAGPMTAHYTIRAESVGAGEGAVPVEVGLRVDHPPRGRVVVQIPVWTPGSYRLRDFPDRIAEVRARAGDRDVPVVRLDRHSYEVTHGDAATVSVSYRVDIPATSRGQVRGTQRRTITYEGPGLYMFVRGHLDIPCHVDFDLPEGWSVATGLVRKGPRRFFAPDYDFLADCPTKMGTFQQFRFESHGKPIEVVVDGPGDIEFDHAAWLANLEKICDVQGEMFGGFPFDRYVFLYSVSPGARGFGGGLEHLTSTTIGLGATALRRSPGAGMGVTAHEFFHLWNVKRMRPVELGPFDYVRPNRTTSLWIAEGFTSYYGEVTQARCGMVDEDAFWAAMQRSITSLENNPAREHVSCTASSEQVWDDVPRDRQVSYYTSGLVMGLLLDIEVRARTGNRRSLDDFMRQMYGLCRDQGRGYREQEVIDLLGRLTGTDFTPFFDRHVRGTVVPPYREILAQAGVLFDGGFSRRPIVRGLGRRGRMGPLTYTDPAPRRGRAVSGELRTVDGKPVARGAGLEDLFAARKPGDTVVLGVGDADAPQEVKATLGSAPVLRLRLRADPEASAGALAIRRGITSR